MKKEPLLELFEPHLLSAIRTAFQAGWSEVSGEFVADVSYMRNRLVGTIANLAANGIADPQELKNQALHALGIGASAPAGGMSNDGWQG
jgi:hypothetical protein